MANAVLSGEKRSALRKSGEVKLGGGSQT